MPTLLDIIPGPTDRAFFAGQTGSGKTYAARKMLQTRRNVVVLDGKGLIDWSDYKLYRSLKGAVQSKERRIVWRPSHAELRDREILDKFFEWVYRRGATTLYVDETYTVTDGDSLPDYYHACLTRGREYGVEVWSATQRPMRIPQVVMSESEHAYVFRLTLEQDRRKIASICDIDPDVLKRLPKKQFYYAPQDGEVEGPCQIVRTQSGTNEAAVVSVG